MPLLASNMPITTHLTHILITIKIVTCPLILRMLRHYSRGLSYRFDPLSLINLNLPPFTLPNFHTTLQLFLDLHWGTPSAHNNIQFYKTSSGTVAQVTLQRLHPPLLRRLASASDNTSQDVNFTLLAINAMVASTHRSTPAQHSSRWDGTSYLICSLQFVNSSNPSSLTLSGEDVLSPSEQLSLTCTTKGTSTGMMLTCNINSPQPSTTTHGSRVQPHHTPDISSPLRHHHLYSSHFYLHQRTDPWGVCLSTTTLIPPHHSTCPL
jgi:hypothetical protein